MHPDGLFRSGNRPWRARRRPHLHFHMAGTLNREGHYVKLKPRLWKLPPPPSFAVDPFIKIAELHDVDQGDGSPTRREPPTFIVALETARQNRPALADNHHSTLGHVKGTSVPKMDSEGPERLI